MSDLVDGATVPWYVVSGRQDPATPKPQRSELPARAVREPVRPPLDPVAAAATTAAAMAACDAEISKFKTAVTAIGHEVRAHTLAQLESRRRWFRSVTESLKEHR